MRTLSLDVAPEPDPDDGGDGGLYLGIAILAALVAVFFVIWWRGRKR